MGAQRSSVPLFHESPHGSPVPSGSAPHDGGVDREIADFASALSALGAQSHCCSAATSRVEGFQRLADVRQPAPRVKAPQIAWTSEPASLRSGSPPRIALPDGPSSIPVDRLVGARCCLMGGELKPFLNPLRRFRMAIRNCRAPAGAGFIPGSWICTCICRRTTCCG